MIQIRNLTYIREGETVLEDITCTLPVGSFSGIIGPNGAGKTTLIRLMLGELTPTRGEILIDGRSSRKIRHSSSLIGYVPQKEQIRQDFPISVYQVVLLGCYGKRGILRRFSSEQTAQVRLALEHVGISHLMNRPVGTLSGGEFQRALIARALCMGTRLLILDEPDAGVDINGQQQILELLKRLHKERDLTIVLVSHDIGVISRYCDCIACLNKTMHFHDSPKKLDAKTLVQTYGGKMDIVLHGDIPISLLEKHPEQSAESNSANNRE